MKKAIISITFVGLFALFAGSAFATNDVICMGTCDPTPGGHHHHNWNKPDMSYKLNSNFNGDLHGGTNTYGSGNGIKEGKSYAVGEQSYEQSGSVNMTDFRSGVACGGNCADNKAELSFNGTQTLNTGGMQESSGTHHSGAFVGSSGQGHFGASGKLNWD